MPRQRGTRESSETAAVIGRLLAHYWASDEPPALRRVIADDWLEDLEEFGPELVGTACREWRRTQTRRPTPADMRALAIAEQRYRAERIAIADRRAERWPQWLAELWGPEPDGPRRRTEAIATGTVRAAE